MKQIKEVCQLSGLSKRTLQFYDEKGLLNVQRSDSNYRIYGEEDIQRIWKILVYKEMGFSLSEIGELLDAGEESERAFLVSKTLELESEIAELERMQIFIDKVLRYGLPDHDVSVVQDGSMTFAEYAKVLSERI